MTANTKTYYPSSMKRQNWMDENYVKQNEINISLGQSRYGGCVIDLPEGIKHPENLWFVAQIDLSKCSQQDKSGLLPME